MILETTNPELCPFELVWLKLAETGYYYTIPPPEIEAAILLMLQPGKYLKIANHAYIEYSGSIFTGALSGGYSWTTSIKKLLEIPCF